MKFPLFNGKETLFCSVQYDYTFHTYTRYTHKLLYAEYTTKTKL